MIISSKRSSYELLECISKIDKTGLELIEHGITSFPIACYHDDLQR